MVLILVNTLIGYKTTIQSIKLSMCSKFYQNLPRSTDAKVTRCHLKYSSGSQFTKIEALIKHNTISRWRSASILTVGDQLPEFIETLRMKPWCDFAYHNRIHQRSL